MNRAITCAGILCAALLAGCSKKAPNSVSSASQPSQTPGQTTPTTNGAPAPTSDLAKLQGIWVSEGEEKGGKIKQNQFKQEVWTITGKQILASMRRVGLVEASQPTPEKLDITFDESTVPLSATLQAKEKLIAIFELSGEKFKLALGMNGTTPKSFDTKADPNIVVLHFKRDPNVKPLMIEPDGDSTKYPELVIGKWHCVGGITQFPLLLGDSQFSKDGKVQMFDSRQMKWEDTFQYKFEKDVLVLTNIAKPSEVYRVQIQKITADEFVSKAFSGKLKRVK